MPPAGFDYSHVKFDSAIRMFLESFRLPGEAQKIDRIINSFGRHYYKYNSDTFRSADAAYVLAYSVIMLNTDQHNNQVKNKMTLESFQRNLRGVNDGVDFEKRFLEEIYYSIVKTALRLSESQSMDVSEQSLVMLAQVIGSRRDKVCNSDGLPLAVHLGVCVPELIHMLRFAHVSKRQGSRAAYLAHSY